MKKYWHDPRYKEYHKKRSQKSWDKKLRFKKYRKAENRNDLGVSKPKRKALNRLKQFSRKAKVVTPPNTMCFLENPDGMSVFIQELKTREAKKTPVYVNMENVTILELNAVTVLLSVMVTFKSSGVKFTGNLPRIEKAKKLMVDSGFFDHLERGRYSRFNEYDLPGSGIYTHGKLLVDSRFTNKLIGDAAETVWGERRRCPGVQRVFIELMQNTNNHAANSQGEQHYWISCQHIKDENRVVFSFVDLGVGIFENLVSKQEGDSYFERAKKLVENYWDNRPVILKRIFMGDLHKTSSGKYFRGKGLPGIHGVGKKNKISKLALITNNVYYDSTRSYNQKLCSMRK